MESEGSKDLMLMRLKAKAVNAQAELDYALAMEEQCKGSTKAAAQAELDDALEMEEPRKGSTKGVWTVFPPSEMGGGPDFSRYHISQDDEPGLPAIYRAGGAKGPCAKKEAAVAEERRREWNTLMEAQESSGDEPTADVTAFEKEHPGVWGPRGRPDDWCFALAASSPEYREWLAKSKVFDRMQAEAGVPAMPSNVWYHKSNMPKPSATALMDVEGMGSSGSARGSFVKAVRNKKSRKTRVLSRSRSGSRLASSDISDAEWERRRGIGFDEPPASASHKRG